MQPGFLYLECCGLSFLFSLYVLQSCGLASVVCHHALHSCICIAHCVHATYSHRYTFRGRMVYLSFHCWQEVNFHGSYIADLPVWIIWIKFLCNLCVMCIMSLDRAVPP